MDAEVDFVPLPVPDFVEPLPEVLFVFVPVEVDPLLVLPFPEDFAFFFEPEVFVDTETLFEAGLFFLSSSVDTSTPPFLPGVPFLAGAAVVLFLPLVPLVC